MKVRVLDVKCDGSKIGVGNNNTVSLEDVNEIEKSRSTAGSSSTSSNLLGNPRSEAQAPLTAFFLPAATSEQNDDGPVDSAEPDPSGNGSGPGFLAEDFITSKSPGEGMDMESQPGKRKLAPSSVRIPVPRTDSLGQSRARPPPSSRPSLPQPRTLQTRHGQLGGKTKHLVQNRLPVDSSDLPDGWRRFKVPRSRHPVTGRERYDLYILPAGPGARILRTQKDVDAYIKNKKLNLNIKFRPWLTRECPRTAARIPNSSQPRPVNILSESFNLAPSSAPRLLPKNAANPRDTRPAKKLLPLNQPAKSVVTPTPCSPVFRIPHSPPVLPAPCSPVLPTQCSPVIPTPCSPVLPLPTLAKALASIGGKDEGSRKLVLFHLTEQQVKAFNILGVKEVGIVE